MRLTQIMDQSYNSVFDYTMYKIGNFQIGITSNMYCFKN